MRMTKKKKIIFWIVISIVGFIALKMIFSAVVVYIVEINNSKLDEKQRKKSFSGVIEKMTFEEGKHIPTVTLKEGTFYCPYDPEIRDIIQINDSIVKEVGSLNYLLYRKDSVGKWKLIHRGKYEKEINHRFPFGRL
jgi:hypothetical protein